VQTTEAHNPSSIEALFSDALSLPVRDGGEIPMSTASSPPELFGTFTRDANRPVAEGQFDDVWTLGEVEQSTTAPALRRIFARLYDKRVVEGDDSTWVEYAWLEVIQDSDSRQFIVKSGGLSSTSGTDEFGKPAYNLYEIPLPEDSQIGLGIASNDANQPVVELIETYHSDNTKVWVLSRSASVTLQFVARIVSAVPLNGSGTITTKWLYLFEEQLLQANGTYIVKPDGLEGVSQNLIEEWNVPRPGSGTVDVSQGVTVGDRVLGESSVLTYLKPISVGALVRISGDVTSEGNFVYHFSVANAWDDEVTCI